MTFKSFGLTHVEYDATNPINKLLALFSLSPVFIMVMFATLIIFRRDFQTIFSVIGQLLCIGINLIIKHIIKQPRPIFHQKYTSDNNIGDISVVESEYGMPSNHSQFICHFATFYSLQLLLKCWSLPVFYRLLYSIMLILLAAITSYSRFQLEYHSVEQVLVGCFVGAISGFTWYIVSNSTMTMSKIICRQPLAVWLGLRDYAVGMTYPPMDEYHTIIQREELKMKSKLI